jgi:hypothetical protein
MSQTKPVKKRRQPPVSGGARSFASHAELMQDMRTFQGRVTSTPDSALAFLQRAGLVTPLGKRKQLIRG